MLSFANIVRDYQMSYSPRFAPPPALSLSKGLPCLPRVWSWGACRRACLYPVFVFLCDLCVSAVKAVPFT